MITIRFTIDNLDSVRQVYDTLELQRSDSGETGAYTTLTSGIDPYPITLIGATSPFTVEDANGTADSWYRTRYYCSSTVNCPDTSAISGWSDPIKGEAGLVCYSPTYPVEVAYGSTDQLIINRIRILIGDPVGLKREYDECDNIHQDNKVYELEEKGWPCSININGTTYNTSTNPTVNGYRYLKFTEDITTVSGVDVNVDIFYYIFRHSDREIMEAYDTCYPPSGLTLTTANQEAYFLTTAIDLLSQESWEDFVEDGAVITDESSKWDPSPGIRAREDMLARLQKRLDDLVKRLLLSGISGILID